MNTALPQRQVTDIQVTDIENCARDHQMKVDFVGGGRVQFAAPLRSDITDDDALYGTCSCDPHARVLEAPWARVNSAGVRTGTWRSQCDTCGADSSAWAMSEPVDPTINADGEPDDEIVQRTVEALAALRDEIHAAETAAIRDQLTVDIAEARSLLDADPMAEVTDPESDSTPGLSMDANGMLSAWAYAPDPAGDWVVVVTEA